MCRGIMATRWVGGWCSLDGEQAQVVDDAEMVARLTGVSGQGSCNFCDPGPPQLIFGLGFSFIE